MSNLHGYMIITPEFETSGFINFTDKSELIASLECNDADDVKTLVVVEFNLSEGWSRDVSEDIAREMVDATEWVFDRDRYNDYRDTDLCAFILHHAEFYAQEVAEEIKREAA